MLQPTSLGAIDNVPNQLSSSIYRYNNFTSMHEIPFDSTVRCNILYDGPNRG